MTYVSDMAQGLNMSSRLLALWALLASVVAVGSALPAMADSTSSLSKPEVSSSSCTIPAAAYTQSQLSSSVALSTRNNPFSICRLTRLTPTPRPPTPSVASNESSYSE